jgi:hypothetical protein
MRTRTRKCERLKGSWVRKRAACKDKATRSRNRFTKWIPAWLGLTLPNGDKVTPGSPGWKNALKKEFDFFVLDGAKEAITMAFKMRLEDPPKSPVVIAETLNKVSRWKPVPHPSKGSAKNCEKTAHAEKSAKVLPFTEAYVRTILFNPAVIGHFQPHRREKNKRVPVGDVIETYYPLALDNAKLFERVQLKRKKSPLKGGRPATYVRNLFRGFAYCPYCGGASYTVCKGEGRPTYFYCINARNRACNRAALFRADELEAVVLNNCKRIDPEAFMTNPSDAKLAERMVEVQIEEVEAGKAKREAEMAALFERSLDPVLKDDKDFNKRYAERSATKQIKDADAETRLLELQSKLERLKVTKNTFNNWQLGIDGLKKAISQKDVAKRTEARNRLNAYLGQLIERVEVFSAGKFDSQTCYPPEVTAWKVVADRLVASAPSPNSDKLRAKWIESEAAKLPKRMSAANRQAAMDKINKQVETRQFLRTGVKYLADAANEGDSIVQGFIGIRQESRAEGDNKLFNEFLKDLAKRRFSREARFVRVWFVTGHKLDLVPEGSIADGLRTVPVDDDGVTVQKLASVSPGIGDLWAQWEKRRDRRIRVRK